MLTLLWKIGPDREEIYETPSISKIPAAPEQSDQLDCGGRAHIAFQKLTPVEDDGAHLHLVRTVISEGEVFVMNSDGKTVAMFRFDVPEEFLHADAGVNASLRKKSS